MGWWGGTTSKPHVFCQGPTLKQFCEDAEKIEKHIFGLDVIMKPEDWRCTNLHEMIKRADAHILNLKLELPWSRWQEHGNVQSHQTWACAHQQWRHIFHADLSSWLGPTRYVGKWSSYDTGITQRSCSTSCFPLSLCSLFMFVQWCSLTDLWGLHRTTEPILKLKPSISSVPSKHIWNVAKREHRSNCNHVYGLMSYCQTAFSSSWGFSNDLLRIRNRAIIWTKVYKKLSFRKCSSSNCTNSQDCS